MTNSNQTNLKSNRIDTLDIAKGIGIILVVWAHARGIFSSYIYQFHMPFFFLISGYLYSRNSTLKEFTVRKLKSLYIPFVSWNILFRIAEAVTGIEEFTFKRLIRSIVKILLTLEKDGTFLGATWFLGALFVVSVLYKIIDTYMDIENKRIIITILFCCLSVIGFSIDFPYMFSRTLVLCGYYAIGVFIKEMVHDKKAFSQSVLAYFCIAVFIVIGHYNAANMGANNYKYPAVFFIGALLASYFFIYISKKIDTKTKYVKKLFVYIGKNSLPILIWQFVSFRIVIALQMFIHGEALKNILDYYPVYDTRNGWWLVYFAVGIVVPLLWDAFLKAGPWGKIFRKLYMVN